jgi:outer membrane protein assembly complex protein YaeT
MGTPSFEGATVPMKDLLERVTEPGDPFNSYRLNQDLRELDQFYADNDFLGAKIRAVRNPRNGEIDIRFVVDEGPRITLAYEGAGVPRRVRNEIREIWISGFSEAVSLRESEDRLLRHFRDEGYLQAKVTHRDDSPEPVRRQFVFRIETGPEFEDPEWVFHGIDPLVMPESAGVVLQNPAAIKERIEFNFRKEGFLDATSTLPELVMEGGKSRFEVTVETGLLYSVGQIVFRGNEALDNVVLHDALQESQISNSFTTTWLNTARQRLISKYWENGFNDIQVLPAVSNDRVESLVNVTFDITEGEQQKIESIRITGNDVTDIGYVTRQFTFKEGDPVDYSRINLTRKHLYDTRLFKRADIDIVRGQQGYLADVKLNENAPWRFRYGFAVANKRQTTDRDLGFTADFSYGNLLGKGILLGTSGKVTVAERDIRMFASFPDFLGREVTTSATLFRTRDFSKQEFFVADLWGFTVQQQWRLKNLYILSYDYGFEYNRTFTPQFDPADIFEYFDVTARVARFNATLSRDSRDDILNATRGTFFSSSTEIAPPGVGSRLTFIKNYSQYFRFQPLREKFVWASAVRAGAGRGFGGQQLTDLDQFTAGGATSVRGFRQDKLSEFSGNAVFVVNQEFRLPLFWRIGAVGFLDAGNIYSTVSDFNPFKLRYSPGVGLRLNTPFALIRMDFGFNLSPTNTIDGPEPRRHFSFGIGQAF